MWSFRCAFTSYYFLLLTTSGLCFSTAYTKNYEDDDSAFMRMLKKASEQVIVTREQPDEGDESTTTRVYGFAEAMLQDGDLLNSEENLKVLKEFLDIAMPAISNTSFKENMAFMSLSEITSECEETFAFLILENNIARWEHLAKKEHEMPLLEGQDGTPTPDVLYQKNVKQRKDGKDTSGKWTDEGMERFNMIADLVIESRANRKEVEKKMTMLYENEFEVENTLDRLRMKRKADADLAAAELQRNKKRKVKVRNLFGKKSPV